MTVQEVAKQVMKDAGMTQADVAKKSGVAGQSTIAMFMKSKAMRVDSLLIILDACGYELVVRDKADHDREYLLDGKEGVRGNQEDGKIERMVKELVKAELTTLGFNVDVCPSPDGDTPAVSVTKSRKK